MALYEDHATGRTRTLKLQGSFSVPIAAGSINVPLSPGSPVWQGYLNYALTASALVDWLGFKITVTTSWINPLGDGHFRFRHQMILDSTASGYVGGESVTRTLDSGDLHYFASGVGVPPPGVDLSAFNEGDYEIEIDVEEWRVVKPFLPVLDRWPPPTDGVLGIYEVFEERIVVGTGVVRFSATGTAGSYSKSFDNATAGVAIGDYRPRLRTSESAVGRYPGGFSSLIVGQCAGISLGYTKTYTFFDTRSPVIVDATHTTQWHDILADGSYPRGGFTNDSTGGAKTTALAGWFEGATMTIISSPPMPVLVSGVTKNFEGGSIGVPGLRVKWYAGGPSADLTEPIYRSLPAGSGAYGDGKTLENVSLLGFGPFTGFINFAEYKTFAFFDPTTMAGEDPRDTAIHGGDFVWDSLELQHDGTLQVDACSATTGWSAGANTTVTASGGAVHLAASGGVGSATRTYSPAKNSEGFRYLDIRHRSTVGNNITVRYTIGQKYWDLITTTAGTYVTRAIDLMCPDGTLSAIPDQQDSRWPIDDATSNTPATENEFWGVNRIVTLLVGGIPDGETIDIDDLTLARQRNATVHISAALVYDSSVDYLTSPLSPTVRRFLLAHTDGRQSLEASDSFASIDDFALELQKIPGFTVNNLGGSDPYFNNTNLFPYFLAAGEGFLMDGTSFLERDIATSLTIKAQFVYDVLGFYPGCGDVIAGGDYGAGVTLKCVPKVFRGQGHGLVVDGSGQPVAAQTVRIVETVTGAFGGQGVSDAAGGYYKTGLPTGRGGKAFDFIGAPPVTGVLIPPRKKVRIQVGPVTVNGQDIDDLQTEDGEHHVSSIAAGDIWHRFCPNTGTAWYIETNVTGGAAYAGGWSAPRICNDPRMRLHLVAYHVDQGGGDPLGDGLYFFESHDNGKTWTDPELILVGATLVMTRWQKGGGSGLRISFWPDSGTTGVGTFKGEWAEVFDAPWSSPVTIVDENGDPLRSAGFGFGFDHAAEGSDRWSLTFVPEGGSSHVSYYIADKGLSGTLE